MVGLPMLFCGRTVCERRLICPVRRFGRRGGGAKIAVVVILLCLYSFLCIRLLLAFRFVRLRALNFRDLMLLFRLKLGLTREVLLRPLTVGLYRN